MRSPRSSEPKRRGRDPLVATLAITGSLDRHDLEALQLEVRRLAGACGLEVQGIDVETVAGRLGRRR